MVWVATTEGDIVFQRGIVQRMNGIFRASLYVWYMYLQCDDLVTFELRAGVKYLSFFRRRSIITNLMKKKQKEPIHMGLKR